MLITAAQLKEARDRLARAERRAAKCVAAQYKLNELHRLAGSEHGEARKAFERLCEQYALQEIARQC